MSIFKSFRSTVTPIGPRNWTSMIRLLVDEVTGAPVGIESPNANGPDGIWTPTILSAAQIAVPTAAMVADLNATYQLNVPPYTRYQSNGTDLVSFGGETPDGSSIPGAVLQTVPPGAPNLVIGPDSYLVVWSPFTVQNAAGVTVLGKLVVISQPA